MNKYLVFLNTPNGEGSMEVPSSSPEAAGRRAQWSAIAAGWGDVGEVTVEEVVPFCECGRDVVGNNGSHCLECELEPFGVAWQLEQQGQL